MTLTIKANITRMFETEDPFYCSNNQITLGEDAGRVTWENATKAARNFKEWLTTPVEDAAEAVKSWARDTGAWDDADIEKWSDVETFALFVQLIASELRELGSDDLDLSDADDCRRLAEASEKAESSKSSHSGFFWYTPEGLMTEWYAGS